MYGYIDNPAFNPNEICQILDIEVDQKRIVNIRKDYKFGTELLSAPKVRGKNIILVNERGMHEIIMGSNSKVSKELKDWISEQMQKLKHEVALLKEQNKNLVNNIPIISENRIREERLYMEGKQDQVTEYQFNNIIIKAYGHKNNQAFVTNEICKALQIDNKSRMVKQVNKIYNFEGLQIATPQYHGNTLSLITRRGVFEIISRSNSKIAVQFRDWFERIFGVIMDNGQLTKNDLLKIQHDQQLKEECNQRNAIPGETIQSDQQQHIDSDEEEKNNVQSPYEDSVSQVSNVTQSDEYNDLNTVYNSVKALLKKLQPDNMQNIKDDIKNKIQQIEQQQKPDDIEQKRFDEQQQQKMKIAQQIKFDQVQGRAQDYMPVYSGQMLKEIQAILQQVQESFQQQLKYCKRHENKDVSQYQYLVASVVTKGGKIAVISKPGHSKGTTRAQKDYKNIKYDRGLVFKPYCIYQASNTDEDDVKQKIKQQDLGYFLSNLDTTEFIFQSINGFLSLILIYLRNSRQQQNSQGGQQTVSNIDESKCKEVLVKQEETKQKQVEEGVLIESEKTKQEQEKTKQKIIDYNGKLLQLFTDGKIDKDFFEKNQQKL